MNRLATKTSTRDTYLASLGLKIFILAKNWSQDPLFVVIGFLSILSTSSEFSIGHAFHLFNLIFALFLIIFLLFASLNTSGTWNMSRPTTKTRLGILIQLCYLVVNFAIPCYYIVPFQAPLSSNQVHVRLATVTLKLQRYHSHRPIASPVALVKHL